MTNGQSFNAEKAHLDEACQALRWFTLARRGSSRRSGLLAVARVNAVCKRMIRLFASGPHALRLTSLMNSIRGRVLAAEARLKLLARRAAMPDEAR
jgi:hypothetical protein